MPPLSGGSSADEDTGLLGQVNVSTKQIMPYYLLREGQPDHYEKRFRWPWPQLTPPRLQASPRAGGAQQTPWTHIAMCRPIQSRLAVRGTEARLEAL